MSVSHYWDHFHLYCDVYVYRKDVYVRLKLSVKILSQIQLEFLVTCSHFIFLPRGSSPSLTSLTEEAFWMTSETSDSN